MAQKFKMRLQVTGFELEIEGSRSDMPLMAQAVGQQMAGLLTPATSIIEGEVIEENKNLNKLQEPQQKSRKKRATRLSSGLTSSNRINKNGDDCAIDWVHDSSKWGTPQQDWTASEKSIWLLCVVAKEASVDKASGGIISATFNKHFRQSGIIRTSQVNRDLGTRKTRSKPSLVGEDTTQNPSAWFLTQEGEKFAQQLIAKALG